MANFTDREILTSVARTATVAATDLQVPAGATFVEISIDVTAIVSSPSVVATIRTARGILVLTSAALTAVSQTALRYGITVPVTTNLSSPGIPHPLMTITMTHGNGNSITYSVRSRAYKP